MTAPDPGGTRDVAIRPLTEPDLEAVVAFSLEAWAPVFAGFESVMGPRVFGLVYPEWRSSQARAVSEVCRSDDVEVWVADADGRPVGFVALRCTEEGATPVGEASAQRCSGSPVGPTSWAKGLDATSHSTAYRGPGQLVVHARGGVPGGVGPAVHLGVGVDGRGLHLAGVGGTQPLHDRLDRRGAGIGAQGEQGRTH